VREIERGCTEDEWQGLETIYGRHLGKSLVLKLEFLKASGLILALKELLGK
jgi:hypothetical protein